MPIFFAYGAASERPRATRTHNSVEHGFFANDSYLFQ
jgi:4,5-DOPA dioxygenase extradiol